jgi:hypothetical protein
MANESRQVEGDPVKATRQTTLERFANFEKHAKKLSEMKPRKSTRPTFKQTTLQFRSKVSKMQKLS